MAYLFTKVKLYLEANGKTENEIGPHATSPVILQNDGDGSPSYIHKWEVSGLAQPTEEQLNSYSAQATTLESNSQVDITRRMAYGSWNDQLDEIYHDIDAWKARLQTIKTNNPKS